MPTSLRSTSARRTTTTGPESRVLALSTAWPPKGWEPFLTEQDRSVLDRGLRKPGPFGFGRRPAVLVVDNVYGVLGFKRLPILGSVQRWPTSFGLEGWAAIDRTAELLAAARARSVPVVFSRTLLGFPMFAGGYWDAYMGRLSGSERETANAIVAEIAPKPSELVIDKAAPSPFFGTPLASYLTGLGVDTVIVCGNSSSGCVRAAVVDAHSYHYWVGVVADCCMDRTQASHHMSMFDMDQKYADVIDLAAARAYLDDPTSGSDRSRWAHQARANAAPSGATAAGGRR